MRDLFGSAAYRIAFIYSAAFALAILGLGVVLFWSMHLAFTRQLDAALGEEATTLAQEYRSDGPQEIVDAIAQREASTSRDRLLYALFDRRGRRIAGSLRSERPRLGLHDLSFVDPREGPDSGRGLAVALGDGATLLVAADRDRIEQIDRTIISVFAAAFLLVVALGMGGALLLGGYLRSRLNAISRAAEAVVGGNLARRMPIGPRGDEFDRLARSLNAMLDRIGSLIENVRQISTDVAHDLRTPLARLRNRLEAGLATAAPGREAALIEDALHRVDDVLALFAAILRIAEVEGGQIRHSFVPVDLSVLASEVAESYFPAVAEGGRALAASVEPNLVVRGDRELLAQALVNLIENAQAHTPSGTHIEICVEAADGAARLVVADDGPGVPEDQRGRIVERFIRLEGSRSGQGHGLGLNLVAAVAALHGGTLRFTDNRPGLRAALELPRERKEGKP
ncbi:MAG: HAMP domain-containing protein [Alphaproteobacteria bacterium]|nr:HAMP domain-containing protein [Alphaproteobacteria bacterium]